MPVFEAPALPTPQAAVNALTLSTEADMKAEKGPSGRAVVVAVKRQKTDPDAAVVAAKERRSNTSSKTTSSQMSTRETMNSYRSVHIPTPRQAFGLFRRFMGLVAAIFYVYSSISSGYWSVRALMGFTDEQKQFSPYMASFIQYYAGHDTIANSPFMRDVLHGDTMPRDFSIYLTSQHQTSRTGCEGIEKFNSWLYGNAFMRWHLDEIVSQTSYNFTFLTNAELVVPIVDCSFSPIVEGDLTSARVYYVMRDRDDTDFVYILMASMSTQDFVMPSHHQKGATAIAVLTPIADMRATDLSHYVSMALGYPFEGPNYQVYTFLGITTDGFVVLDSVPRNQATDRKKRVLTANRKGYYLNAEESQSNIKNLFWSLSEDPLLALTKWQWNGVTVLRNSWGWVRYINFYFAIDSIFNLCVLLLVIFRNYQRGKIWIGDAFISFSDTLLLRGAAIIVLWILEGFWSLSTFTLRAGNALGSGIGIFYFRQITHGDLMTIYISLAGVLGILLRERINPAIVVALFELGFQYRNSIVRAFPPLVTTLMDNAREDYFLGVSKLPDDLADFSPFLFWTTHRIKRSHRAVIAALIPIFSTFLVIVMYALGRKVWRWHKERMRRKYQGNYVREKTSLTAFEIASGAALQNRVGLVCDYDSCVYIKGLKFASPDGIYCNGFVIANGKWLIRTGDLMAIIFMIVTRVRFYDLYVYEVKDHTVNQTAVLVYPTTMTLSELLKLNTTILA